jgi:hypothetical protein
MTTVVVVVRCMEQNLLPESCRPWECEEAVVHCGCFCQVSWSPGVNSGYPHPRQTLALLHSLHWHGSLYYHCMFLYSVTMTLALLFLQPQLWTIALLTDFWPKLSKLSKGHCKWISIWCVLNLFWCISVSLWEFCLWWNGTWFEHGCFSLWQCVKIDHAGECWESDSYKQEKVTEALQVHSGRPGDMTEETFDSLQHQIPGWIIELSVWGMLPKGQVGISLSLSYCARMDMHQQVNICGSAHVYYVP